MQKQIEQGFLRCTEPVLKEITEGDQLATWIDGLKPTLFISPNEAVQRAYRPIADHVRANYKPHWANRFLDGADGWVIAQAQIDKGTVVSQENERREKRAKIPVVSREFGVDCITLPELLRKLGARF